METVVNFSTVLLIKNLGKFPHGSILFSFKKSVKISSFDTCTVFQGKMTKLHVLVHAYHCCFVYLCTIGLKCIVLWGFLYGKFYMLWDYMPIYTGIYRIYCPPREQLFHEAKPRKLAAVKGDIKLAIIRIVSQ